MKPLSKFGINPMMTISPTGEIREVMTLRDHFAGLAMQGLLTAELVGEYSNDHVAEIAYVIADAMLKERNK